MSRALTPATGNETRLPGSKQWKLRTDQTTQENRWVEQQSSFAIPHNSMQSAPPGHERPAKQVRIDTRTTSESYGRQKYQLGQQGYRYSYAHTDDTRSSIDSSNFSLDMRRSEALSWDVHNPMDIINDYQEPIRPLPSTLPPSLPPVPDLAPPLGSAYRAGPPRSLDELEARNSLRASSVLRPSHERKVSSGITRGHAKTHSQARLLPLMAGSPPRLTKDKPTTWQAHNALTDDLVSIHWIVLASGFLFPPIFLLLGFSFFDSLLGVPELPGPSKYQMLNLSPEERDELRRIRRIKWFAIILGIGFWCLCLAGIIVGLLLRPDR